ncbi:hypothetical protein VPIG_00115 [Vibrio phage PWH3a-P1]|uniref:hypothetical protein n=1 Tax=Vibrio phage PWH3a-P1 TaxID=754058 RepID=UPI0002C0D247|nr:hypothetical protein VPIG_00115 [Vibrio phage PWH3a-P1]AGH31972.1 hypothetical protein VPIG_00115 [Vibrio phage PWH3a-P1]
MFDIHLIIYQIKMFFKRLTCSHINSTYTETDNFHVHTCNDCGKQTLERKYR